MTVFGNLVVNPMTQAPANPARHRQVIACFIILQLVSYGIVLLVVAANVTLGNPWKVAVPVVCFGTLLAHCQLAAAAAVLGPWRMVPRVAASAAIVLVGVNSLEIANIIGTRSPVRADDFFFICFFSLALWTSIQIPFWLSRLVLGTRVVWGETKEGDGASSRQYGIRQLMALTLTVSIALGIGRWIIPETAANDLANIEATDWAFFVILAVALALVAATTTITSLNPFYWQTGIAVAAISSVLIAWSVYSISFAWGLAAPTDRRPFAFMILWTYVWLQLSVLLVRAAGYRIIVRT